MTPSSALLAYAGRPGADLAAAVVAFGWDYAWVAAPTALVAVAVVLLARRAPRGTPVLHRMGHGAAGLSGLPAWCAGPLVLLVGALLVAFLGFIWDVAWHIGIGRDEFLFSPPHVALLVGLLGLGLAGAASIAIATRDRVDVGWRVDRWQVPYGAAALLVAGASALVGFGVDELWHAAYGLDVTMWSPPHLTMISTAAFSPLSGWILLAEAGPRAGRRPVRVVAGAILAGAALIGLSAWQLEFDLGVPQWPAAYHPILVALAAGFGLCAARAALGRGGALVAVGVFLALRGGLALITSEVFGLTQPRLVPYLAAALAVEAVWALRGDRRSTPLVAGLAVATVGLAGAWAAQRLWGYHPWRTGLLPWLPVAAGAAVGAAVLGTALGRAVAHRPTGIGPRAAAACLLVVVAALASPLPRSGIDATADIRTTEVAPGLVEVEIRLDPPDAAVGADRFEVMAWQGGGLESQPFVAAGDGRWVTAAPVPVGGTWKTLVRIADGRSLAAAPVALPPDPEIGAPEVPLAAQRTVPLVVDEDLMLRESTDGPAWPGVLGYTFVAASILALVGLQAAGVAGLERRRRGGAPDLRIVEDDALAPAAR